MRLCVLPGLSRLRGLTGVPSGAVERPVPAFVGPTTSVVSAAGAAVRGGGVAVSVAVLVGSVVPVPVFVVSVAVSAVVPVVIRGVGPRSRRSTLLSETCLLGRAADLVGH
ncbi:hypothetical protein [Streptomyces sp. CC77]|uniref:hypothetical protein n=1 Tax=Streptomyces sp. CC77 TaxID=1906739 RepID=UPI0008DE2A21|nr:hypothetical protein [Streptomyces sp. CC77]OII70174.1 hypothetical protein BJP39_03210 [Streptomyces sp. CC77]